MRWLLLAGVLLLPGCASAADPSALWQIVNGKCVPHEAAVQNPAPCSDVEITEGVDKGYAVLKDINGKTQFLLIPTARISGIEDPAVLKDGATNYWGDAWRVRYFVEQRAGSPLPRDAIALAINSPYGRSQNQLHIHIDCIRPDVRAALADDLDKVGTTWAPFPVALAGHHYQAIRIDGDTLDQVNPFRVLRAGEPGTDMGRNTLVAVGETFPDGIKGFVLLDDQADLATGDRASGEELQDHTCAVAAK